MADGDRTWLLDGFSESVVLEGGGGLSRLFQVDPGAGGSITVAGPCR